MNDYEITHEGIKHKIKGDKLFTSMMNWCVERKIDLNEIESCVLVPKKEVKPIKGLSETHITDLIISCDRKQKTDPEHYEIRINILSLSPKGSGNINKFFNRLLEKQNTKR